MDSIYDAQGLSLDNILMKMKQKIPDVTLDNTRIVSRLCDLAVYLSVILSDMIIRVCSVGKEKHKLG